jgi:hypothetical protein
MLVPTKDFAAEPLHPLVAHPLLVMLINGHQPHK